MLVTIGERRETDRPWGQGDKTRYNEAGKRDDTSRSADLLCGGGVGGQLAERLARRDVDRRRRRRRRGQNGDGRRRRLGLQLPLQVADVVDDVLNDLQFRDAPVARHVRDQLLQFRQVELDFDVFAGRRRHRPGFAHAAHRRRLAWSRIHCCALRLNHGALQEARLGPRLSTAAV